MEITLKTLTPLWTGGIDQTADRLHETGLLGSLRWWYEALVRGLGGYACDPTADGRRCEYDPKKPDPPEKQLCAACYLFGCTGWARKFRLRVRDTDEQLIQYQLQKDTEFVLEFIELRPIRPEEKWLLTKAIEIAAKYGALGGKTTSLRKGYGVVKLVKPVDTKEMTKDEVIRWLSKFRQVEHDEWADLRRFIFIPGKALDKDPREIARRIDTDFLLGQKSPEKSRKIFVFKKPDRTFAYFRNQETYQKVLNEWKAIHDRGVIKTGEEVLHEL